MVTFLIIIAVLAIAVGLWILNQKQNKGLNEANTEVHPFINDLAPEATPEPTIVKAIATPAPKKKATTKKPVAKKTVKKSK